VPRRRHSPASQGGSQRTCLAWRPSTPQAGVIARVCRFLHAPILRIGSQRTCLTPRRAKNGSQSTCLPGFQPDSTPHVGVRERGFAPPFESAQREWESKNVGLHSSPKRLHGSQNTCSSPSTAAFAPVKRESEHAFCPVRWPSCAEWESGHVPFLPHTASLNAQKWEAEYVSWALWALFREPAHVISSSCTCPRPPPRQKRESEHVFHARNPLAPASPGPHGHRTGSQRTCLAGSDPFRITRTGVSARLSPWTSPRRTLNDPSRPCPHAQSVRELGVRARAFGTPSAHACKIGSHSTWSGSQDT
jgi:hypothetical protein